MGIADDLESHLRASIDTWCGSKDCPRGCAPLANLLEAVGAIAKRDDDVRTLDEWAWANSTEPAFQTVPSDFPSRGEWGCCGGYEDTRTTTRRRVFYGATPDEARAKAAAWVREQAKKGA